VASLITTFLVNMVLAVTLGLGAGPR